MVTVKKSIVKKFLECKTFFKIFFPYTFLYFVYTCFKLLFFAVSSLKVNPPEAIRNLVTPVNTPRSVRPGFFFKPQWPHHGLSDQVFFFLTHFAPGRVKGHTSLTDRFFFF